MPLPPLAGIVRMAVRSTLGDDMDMINVHHLNAAGSPPYSGTDLLAAAHTFFTIWATVFTSLMSTDAATVSVTAKDLSVHDGSEATYVAPTPSAGTRASPSLPANCALVVSWKESLSYRGGHPRTYISGLPTASQTDPQHMSGAYKNDLQTAGNTFISDIPAASWPSTFAIDTRLVVVHYSLHGFVGTLPFDVDIQSALVNTRIDSQRRRLGA